MKLYIKSSMNNNLDEEQIFYNPYNQLCEEYNGQIPYAIYLDFLIEAFNRMNEVGCLDDFVTNHVDPASECVMALEEGEFDEDPTSIILSRLEDARAEAFAFEEAGYPEIANEILDNIEEAKSMLQDLEFDDFDDDED